MLKPWFLHNYILSTHHLGAEIFCSYFLDKNYFLTVLSILLCPDTVLQSTFYLLIELIRTRSNYLSMCEMCVLNWLKFKHYFIFLG